MSSTLVYSTANRVKSARALVKSLFKASGLDPTELSLKAMLDKFIFAYRKHITTYSEDFIGKGCASEQGIQVDVGMHGCKPRACISVTPVPVFKTVVNFYKHGEEPDLIMPSSILGTDQE